MNGKGDKEEKDLLAFSEEEMGKRDLVKGGEGGKGTNEVEEKSEEEEEGRRNVYSTPKQSQRQELRNLSLKGAEGGRRGRISNVERLKRETGQGPSQSNLEGWRFSSTQSSSEGEREDKRKREEIGGEREGGLGRNTFAGSKKTRRSPYSRSEEKELGKIEELIGSFRKETIGRLERVERQGGELKEELRKMREKWYEWERMWIEEREKVWEKFEKLDEKQRKTEEQPEKEWTEVRRRLEALELSEKRGETSTQSQGRNEEEDRREEQARMRKITQLEKMLERNERERRVLNLVIRNMEIGSETGREEVEGMLKKIGVEGVPEEIKRVGPKEKGMLLLKMKNWKDKKEVLVKKKGLKGTKIRIDNDLTHTERRMRWRITEKVRSEKERGREVRWGYDRMWTEGVEWRWCEESGDLIEIDKEEKKKEQRTKGTEVEEGRREDSTTAEQVGYRGQ